MCKHLHNLGCYEIPSATADCHVRKEWISSMFCVTFAEVIARVKYCVATQISVGANI